MQLLQPTNDNNNNEKKYNKKRGKHTVEKTTRQHTAIAINSYSNSNNNGAAH